MPPGRAPGPCGCFYCRGADACGTAYALRNRTPIISAIRIVGNQRVEEDAIRIHITAQPGQPLNDATVDQDVKAIYQMGFFTDVHASVEHQGGQAILIYHVKERPLITDVRTEG